MHSCIRRALDQPRRVCLLCALSARLTSSAFFTSKGHETGTRSRFSTCGITRQLLMTPKRVVFSAAAGAWMDFLRRRRKGYATCSTWLLCALYRPRFTRHFAVNKNWPRCRIGTNLWPQTSIGNKCVPQRGDASWKQGRISACQRLSSSSCWSICNHVIWLLQLLPPQNNDFRRFWLNYGWLVGTGRK